jgi:hypothetical protein
MDDQVRLSREELQRLVRTANDMGHNGTRVISLYVLSGTSATGDAYAWRADDGPESATQTWEDR